MNKDTYVKVDKSVFHLNTKQDSYEYYLCAWYIHNISSLKLISSCCISVKDSMHLKYYSTIDICPDPKGKVPLKHSCKQIIGSSQLTHIYCAFIEGEDFQKLQELPDSTNIIICRMKYCEFGETVPEPTPAMNSEYISSLKEDLKQYPGTSSKEIVNLRVGEETECVNKAILCVRSPVFAKMFENDMKELKYNIVIITDIRMPVLRALVSFLYSGTVPDCDFDFLCQLYYAADKYDIKDLRLACISLLVSKAALENLFQLLKLSLLHNDELLKSVAMTLIYADIKLVILMPDWKNFMHEDPEIALEAATFFD